MNPEILISQAAEVLAKWQLEHDSACTLYVSDGQVCCAKQGPLWVKGPPVLNITKWKVIHGLTFSEWHRVGNQLLTLYTKEKQCQAHQKP